MHKMEAGEDDHNNTIDINKSIDTNKSIDINNDVPVATEAGTGTEKEKAVTVTVAVPPHDLRCKRTDGRDWRCKQQVIPGKSYCLSHLHRSNPKKNKPPINNNPNPNPKIKKPVKIKLPIKPKINPNPENNNNLLPPLPPPRPITLSLPAPKRVKIRVRVKPEPQPQTQPQPVPKPKPHVLFTCSDKPRPIMPITCPEEVIPHVSVACPEKGETYVSMACPVVENGTADVVGVAMKSVSDTGKGKGQEKKVVSGRMKRGAPVLVPEHLRCARNDGRTWRCKREVVEGGSFCEVHLQYGAKKRPRTGVKAKEKKEKEREMSVVREEKGVPLLEFGEEVGVGMGVSVECEKERESGTALLALAAGAGIGMGMGVGEEEKEGKTGGKKRKERGEVAAEEVRCRKTDGREWRCKRRVVDGELFCDGHLVKKGYKSSGGEKVGREETKKKKKKERKTKEKGARVENLALMPVKVEPECDEVGALVVVEEKRGEEENGNVVAKESVVSEKGKDKGKMMVEEWRCKRTDGRGWWCKRRVVEGKTLCEIHHEQGKLRNKRETVPELLKIQRGSGGAGEKRVEKELKRKRALEELESSSDKGMKRMKAELIRGFLRREIIEKSKKKKKSKKNGEIKGCENANKEVTRDLPYGLMEIPPPPPAQLLGNVGSLRIKVGVQSLNNVVNRRFRSKNIEPPPIGPLKVVPYVGDMGKVRNNGRKKCHWCRSSEHQTLTKCSSCRKRYFCSDCIKERSIDPQELKSRCPVCRQSCDCKGCSAAQSKAMANKDFLKLQFKGSKTQRLQYLINFLLPILEKINHAQNVELETEAKFKGQSFSEVEVRLADVGCSDRCCCNNCKSPILDFHRSCPNCSYILCLSCCREYSQSGSLGGVNSCHNQTEGRFNGLQSCPGQMQKSACVQNKGYPDQASSASLVDSTACLPISCPPMELGGCDNSLLDLRCIFPLNWTKELEISATEMASDKTIDDTAHCSFCGTISRETSKSKEVQEASRRKGSEDNFLYCPSASDDHDLVLCHFQYHWRMGHPVKVRNVLHAVSSLSWDPLSMFCSYLEATTSDCTSMKDGVVVANCTDCYDIELGVTKSFSRTLEEGYTQRQRDTLKIKAKLSSTLTHRLFEEHFGEVIHSLPLQEYTNPRSGLLNLSGKLPEDFPHFKLGPQVCITCGGREEVARGELLNMLCYNSYDLVNILVYAGDVSCSAEQINKVKKLMRRNKVKGKGECNLQNPETEDAIIRSEISTEAGDQGVAGTSSCSGATNDISTVNLRDDKSPAKIHGSDTDSDASMICSGTTDSTGKSVDQTSHLDRFESSTHPGKSDTAEVCGVEWDVFRRQDLPKLREYIERHVDELTVNYGLQKKVIHSILDGSFYLNPIHKLKLKEEFDIEPWTFNQCIGEAVLIPAGCPYQIRRMKSCVNIEMGFVSPENASECIKLMEEIRVLPNNHRAKHERVEVEKMAICSIDEAIKEMYRLISEERSQPNTGELLS